MTAANALLQAIHRKLSGDAALTAIIGADGIRDRLLPRANLPSIVFGEIETRDFSTDGGPGEEHLLVLEIWSEAEGRRQAQEVAGLLHGLLHDAALALDGSLVLVNLQQVGMRSRREPKTKFHLAEMRFRAVTE